MITNTTESAATKQAPRTDRSKQISWAVKLHINYTSGNDATGKPIVALENIWVQGVTKTATMIAAKQEQVKQLAIAGTISCWIGSGCYPVTKPLR